MRTLFLVMGLLLMGSEAKGQAQSVVSPKSHPCEVGTDFVRAHSGEYPPDWSIVVVCNRSEFERYEKTWGASVSLGAFTVLEAKRTFILYDLHKSGSTLNDLASQLLIHELKHIRCNCTLGEK